MVSMKKWFAVLAISAFGLVGAVQTAHAAGNAQGPSPRDLFLESESPLGYAETIDAIKKEADAMSWSVLTVHDMSAILAKKGHTIAPVSVMEVCSGKYSVSLLKNEATRYVSSMIPCRLAVYQNAAGKVIINRMNTKVMGTMMEPAVNEVMAKAGADLEKLIEKVSSKK